MIHSDIVVNAAMNNPYNRLGTPLPYQAKCVAIRIKAYGISRGYNYICCIGFIIISLKFV